MTTGNVWQANIQAAIDAFWGTRLYQAATIGNGVQGGTRNQVLAAKHLDAIRTLIIDGLTALGVPGDHILWREPGTRMPGYYRVTKNWDLAATDPAGNLIALLELKSITSSYGNNLNNRIEEALGSVTDIDAAITRNIVPVRPWLGYVMIMGDDAKSRKQPQIKGALYPTDPAFSGATYLDRAQAFIERVVDTGPYNAGWYVTSQPPSNKTAPAAWDEPSSRLNWTLFYDSLSRHVQQYWP